MSRVIAATLLLLTSALSCRGRDRGHDVSPEGASTRRVSRKPGPPPVSRSTSRTVTGWNHPRTVPFRDPDAVVRKGLVTKIMISHAGYIHGIQLYYGANGVGTFQNAILRTPGRLEGKLPEPTKTSWRVPEGQRIVRIEGRIVGHYMSRLQFVTDRGKRSPQFGGSTPGKDFVVEDPTRSGLRTISGHLNPAKHKATGIHRAITSMTFHFGGLPLRCYIKEIKYDLAALDAAKLKAAPQRLASQDIPNRTSAEQQVVYTTKTLTFNQSIALELGLEITAGLPGLVETKSSFKFTSTTEFGQSYENSSTQEVSWSVPVRVPPRKRIIATSTVKRFTASVPFTYTVAWYQGTKDNIKRQVTLSGIYHGVHIEDLKHDFREAPLE